MQLSRQIVPEAKSTPTTKPAPQAALTPAQVQRLSEIKQRAGWIPPDYQLDLAKSGATNEAVDAVANMKAKQIVDDQASEEPEGGWLRRNVYDRLKAGSRWLTAGLNFVPEFVQGGLAQLTDDNTNVDGWFISTSLGSMIENPELQGEGFFAGEKLMEKQAERARRYRGTVNGSAWTVGRGAANIVFKPNSKPYNIMSGILDAVVMVKADPTGPITKAAKYVTKGGNTVPLFADEATRALREALESEAGITRGLAGATLDGTKFDRFTRTNGRMVRLIDRLTQEKDALRISEDIFDHNIPNEMAVALADAKDPDVVRAILATGWTVRGGTTLPQDIRLIQGNRISSAVGDFLAERAPFVDGIKKSRYFTKMGDARVITHGTQDDNRKAVQSIVSYLRTAGVDQEEIKKIGDLALRSFTPVASDVARKRTMDAFYSSMKAVMKLDGIPDESIDELFNVGRRKTDQIRRYLQDRLGRPFDNGYRSYLMNKDRGFVPEEQIETIIKELGLDLGEKAAITSPTELVELLDRMIVLPDLREVRRFTRNPLFREVMTKTVVTDQKLFDDLTRQLNELLAKTEPTDYDKSTIGYIRKQLESLQVKAPRGDKFAKFPVTAKRQKRMVTVIKDQKRFDELTEEMNTIFAKAAADEADMARVEEIQKELSTLKVKEERKVITPDQRAGLAAVDFIQNELWKPLALATGGYVVRNSLDAQVRMAFSELPSLFTHPFEYINLVLGTSKKMTLRLEDISKVRAAAKAGEILPEGTVTLDDVVADVREALTFNLRQQGLGANEIENHMVATGSFDNVQRDMANGLELHTDAVVQNGRRTQADTLRKVATQTFVEMGGVSKPAIDQAANRIVNIILSDDAIRKQIDDLHEYGFEITSQSGKSVRTPPIILRDLDEAERKAAYRQYAYRISVGNAQILTGSVPEAEFMYAFGYVPRTKAGKMDGAFESPLKDLDILEGEGRVGSIVQVAPNEIGIITKLTDLSGQVVIDPFDGTTVELLGDVATVQPVFPDQAFTQTYGSREARKLIQQLPVSDDPAKAGLPAVLKRELMMNDERNKDKIQTIRDTYDKGVDWFFGQAYASVTRKLERSPVFREYYYRQVTELADRLKPEDAQRFLDDVAEKAKEAGVSVQKYVGSKDLIAAMKKSASTQIATGPKVLNPTLVAESGTLFHGTATQVAGKKFGDIFSVVAEDANNLFGRGLYLTDSPNVAISYTAKGAATRTKIGNIPVNPEGFVYRVKPSATAKLIDLRQPSQEVNRIVGSFLDDQLESLLEYATEDEFAAIRGLLANPKTTGETVISAFKKLFRGETQEIADIYMQEITVALRDVADGLIYKGGVRRGGLGEHTAYVFLNENAVQIVDEVRPTVSAAARGKDVGLEELDDYAKHVALNQTKELLYDASNRSNLEDVLRVIMPFAPAWKEIMGTYAGFLKSNPLNAGRSFQRIYTGLQGADPDNDGRGFFYEDPTTGQMMFTFPGTGTLAKVLTGLDAPLEAPVKRLSQGIQGFPALGPMAQVGYSIIAPHVPQAEFFTSLLLPYGLKGPQTAFNPTPQWLQKLTQVFTAPTEQLDTQYANLYIDTMRALSASGDYDLSSKSDLRQLEEDAKFKARILMAFRALSQFTGPTAGTTEFKIETDQGDIFVSQLIKEFYDMQADPDIGYDKAVPRFLELYGDEAALYVASKTRSVAEGLEATKEFQDWRDANKDLVKDYPDVANYLAPAGSDFNFSVWNLQLQRGERVRLSSREIIELAQRRIGSAKYRQARLQVGPYPSEEAKALLSQYREVLHKQYPGFPANAEFEVGAFYNDVRDLKDMVLDSRVAGDETAGAIKEYLLARDKAIALSGVSEEGFKTAKSAARYRAGLESVGLALTQQYPNFARIYDRLLASEVE